MKTTIRTVILFFMLLTAILVLSACAEKTPYEEYDEEGYTVSVKYDANGGMFTTSVEVIVDSYQLSKLPTNANGQKELALLSPDDTRRGTGNAFQASNAGYFLAGWYTERIPYVNEKGETEYTYSGRWDFEQDLWEVDPASVTTSSEAVVTLYAAWIPQFKYEFYSLDTKELIGEYLFDPNYISEIALPSWNEDTGTLKMERFPKIADKTWEAAYLDENGTQAVTGTSVVHTGEYHADNATAENPVMKLYLDYRDGEWFRIYKAEQLADNASVRGCYEICADLDFAGVNWPESLMYANFRGQIIGNGHTVSNISVEQKDTKRQNMGLFGSISAEAKIENITFSNVTLTVKAGTLQQDASIGLLTGLLDKNATMTNVAVTNSKLLIYAGANFPAGTSIGLLCGSGSAEGYDLSGISCEAVGDTGENPTYNSTDIVITVEGNDVTVTPAS